MFEKIAHTVLLGFVQKCYFKGDMDLIMNIDISIVTYNSRKWVNMFFDSLLLQEYPTNKISVFITDNGSSDDTIYLLEVVKKANGNKFHQFEINKSNNVGFGRANNDNLKCCKSKYVLVTNIDLEFEKGSIKEIITIAENDSDNVCAWELRQKPYEHPKYYNPITLITPWASSACVLFRKDALKIVGGYDPKIFMYGEDVDISYRLRDCGYIIKYCPSASVWHYSYAEENEVKPNQFLGSTSARLYLACRFASVKEIVKTMLRYYTLIFENEQFLYQKRKLLKAYVKSVPKMVYFLSTRKKSDEEFTFYGWDYTIRRDGAFYKYPKVNLELNPLISVIIRTYNNRNGLLKNAIKSILNQTYSNIEIVVVEDGTTYAKEYTDLLKKKCRIVYKSIEKAGRCVAGNVGLELASGDYLCFLDDDDALFPDHFEVLLNGLIANNYKVGYSNAFEVETTVIDAAKGDIKEGLPVLKYNQNFSRILLSHHNYIPIQTILFHRSLYKDLGGFDEQLDSLEDWNLWTRYASKEKFVYIPKTTSLYRVPQNRQINEKRQKQLNDYYSLALENQKDMKLSCSMEDLRKELEEVQAWIINSTFTPSKKSRVKCVLRRMLRMLLVQGKVSN